MESHKEQAISSQFVFLKTFKGQEYMGSYPSRAEASFHHFLHNILQTKIVYSRICVGYASHNLISSCSYDLSI